MFARRRTAQQFHQLTEITTKGCFSAKEKRPVASSTRDSSQPASQTNFRSSIPILNIKDLAERVSISAQNAEEQKTQSLDGKFRQIFKIAPTESKPKTSQTKQNLQSQENSSQNLENPQPQRVRVYLNNKLASQRDWMDYFLKEQAETEAETLAEDQYEKNNHIIIQEDQQNLLFLQRKSCSSSQNSESDFWQLLEGEKDQDGQSTQNSGSTVDSSTKNILEAVEKQLQLWNDANL